MVLTIFAVTFGSACAPAWRPPSSGRARGVTVEDPMATSCSPRALPPDFGQRGVVRMPREVWSRALAPVLAALCGCAPTTARVVVTVTPNLGEVVASMPDDPSANACLGARLRSARFEPFDMGAGSDCIDCGPPPARTKPRGPSFTTVLAYVP